MSRKGYRHPFLVGTAYFGGVGDEPRTLVDLAMSQFSAEIRRSKDWFDLHTTESFRSEWMKFASERVWLVKTVSDVHEVHLSPKQIIYVLDELDGYEKLYNRQSGSQVSCFERIYETEKVLSPDDLASLHLELRLLRESRLSERSVEEDGVTTVLIDPHNGCLVYGKTLVSVPNRKSPRPEPAPEKSDIYTVSQKYALLPSDVYVSSSLSAKILSYIIDLDPLRDSGYLNGLLDKTLSSLVPLFQSTLTDLHRNNPLPHRITAFPKYTEWDEPDSPEFSDDEQGWIDYERDMRQWVMNRPIALPDVHPQGYLKGSIEKRKLLVNLAGSMVKIIVRVEEVKLKPGGPDYPGQLWHIEGMKNERIAACGLFFPAVRNVNEPSVNFRMATSYPRGYSAGDTGATLRTWGLRDGSPCHQQLGYVRIREGLGLTFPNIYQYSISPFTLADRNREGTMTIVSFLLVDPDISSSTTTNQSQPTILSTSQCPPQSMTVIRHVLDRCMPSRIPGEIIDRILHEANKSGFLNSEDEMARRRLEARNEREDFTKKSNLYHFCVPFDIWNGPWSPP